MTFWAHAVVWRRYNSMTRRQSLPLGVLTHFFIFIFSSKLKIFLRSQLQKLSFSGLTRLERPKPVSRLNITKLTLAIWSYTVPPPPPPRLNQLRPIRLYLILFFKSKKKFYEVNPCLFLFQFLRSDILSQADKS